MLLRNVSGGIFFVTLSTIKHTDAGSTRDISLGRNPLGRIWKKRFFYAHAVASSHGQLMQDCWLWAQQLLPGGVSDAEVLTRKLVGVGCWLRRHLALSMIAFLCLGLP